MSAHPTPSPLPSEDDAHIRAVLHELMDIGIDLARDLARRAKTDPKTVPKEAAADYDRIARAIRRTALLLRHLATQAAVPDRVGARKRIIREVEDTIQRRADGPEAESLRTEFADRLDSLDLEKDLLNRPLNEIILDICRDLGLASVSGPSQWKRRTPADLQDLCARAAAPPGTAAPRPTTPPPKPTPNPAPTPAPQPAPDLPKPPRAAAPPSTPPETAESLLHYLTRSRGT